MKQNILIIFFIVFSLTSWANEKFLIDGDTLIYDTFKVSDETQAEINWEDLMFYYKFFQKTLI